MPDRLPELARELRRVVEREMPPRLGRDRHDSARALALVLKIVSGKSADEMKSIYSALIEEGVLPFRKAPHQNTISNWMNDPGLGHILERMLEISARPFRAVEVAGIVDSTKMSHMRSAHSRWVEYGDDDREQADWMKVHALVGVESLFCIAILFSGSRGWGTHDINFILPLFEKLAGRFNLRYLLADKAYLSEDVVGRLWEVGVQAVIPLKKRWDGLAMKRYYEAFQNLVKWYDNRQADFHEFYRLRPKVESFFSLIKRMADGFCWSRGRKRVIENVPVGNATDPCTVWRNETLCKFIFVNLRIVVEYEHLTGYAMNFVSDTFFREIPENERLIA